MPSCWIRRRETKGGLKYHVRYRLGGRAFPELHAGAFDTLRDAKARKRWIDGEISAGRAPDLEAIARPAEPGLTVAGAAEEWQASRIDVSEATRVVHRVALRRLLPQLGDQHLDALTPAQVAAWIADLKSQRYKRSTIQKSLTALRQVLDHHGIDPNPARDRRVRLPREERLEIEPPTAAHVEAVLGAVAPRYRLPILILDSVGQRIGELEALAWGDLDEREQRWRVTRKASKTSRPRWVQVPADVWLSVLELMPREDREPVARVFPFLNQERLRTEIARACRATGTPLFSPHDLRHRRISLWHRDGVPWAEIGARVGQRSLSVTADTYTHVVADGEVQRGRFL
jgi:integrase